MNSNIHRFLSRRDRRQKVNLPSDQHPSSPSIDSSYSPSPSSSPFSTITRSVVSSLLFWRHRGPHPSTPNSLIDDHGYDQTRRPSNISSAWSTLDVPFSLDGAGSIRRPRKQPPSTHVAHHNAIASTANCDIAFTLQTAPDIAPDVGTFAGFFIPDDEAKKKKFDKDEEKAVRHHNTVQSHPHTR